MNGVSNLFFETNVGFVNLSGKTNPSECPECGSEVLEIRDFLVCEGFGCKWQDKNLLA